MAYEMITFRDNLIELLHTSGIYIIITKFHLKFNKKKINSYDEYLCNLLTIIQKKGVLVKVMKKEDNFLEKHYTCYNKQLGAVSITNIKGNVISVYVAYEDLDGSIKYYVYPKN
jgi:hypothetical protein